MNRSRHNQSLSRARLAKSQTTEIASWQTPDSRGLRNSNSRHADRNPDGWPELLKSLVTKWSRWELLRGNRNPDSSAAKQPRNNKISIYLLNIAHMRRGKPRLQR